MKSGDYLSVVQTSPREASMAPVRPEDVREHEATEMNHQDGVAHNSDSSMPVPEDLRVTSASTERSEGFPHGLHVAVKKFWKRQVRATVAHEACRDHFGTPSFSSLTI